MIGALFQGVILGIILSVLIGPVFFLLIQTSIKKGFRAAMFLEAGIFLSDAFCIWLSYMGLANIVENPEYEKAIAVIGGGILIGFGVVTFMSHKPMKNVGAEEQKIKPGRLALKGFLFNISNPSVILFWIGAVGVAISRFKTQSTGLFSYFFGTLVTVLGIDILKAYLANKIKSFLTPKMFDMVNKIAGTAIIVFGVYLILSKFL
jgi:threonine/homoserine/homoserine lactone efflux protein